MLSAVAVTPDGHWIIGGYEFQRSYQSQILIWDFATGRLVRSHKVDAYSIGSMLVTPDNRSVLFSGSERGPFGTEYFVKIADIRNGKFETVKRWEMVGPYDLGSYELTFTADKKSVLFSKFVWDWQTGGEPRLRNNERVANRFGEVPMLIYWQFLETYQGRLKSIPAITADHQYIVAIIDSVIRVIHSQTGDVLREIVPTL